MEKRDVVHKLDELLRTDIDSVHAYDQALKRIDLPEVYARIERHREDHRRHVETLTRLIRELGGEPTRQTGRFRGFLTRGFTMITIQAFASVRSVRSTEAALDAMENNEKLTVQAYVEAVSWEVDTSVHDVLSAFYSDERDHLTYIQKLLKHKIDQDPYHPVRHR